MIRDSIEFPDEVRWILFVLLGELPLQGSSDMAYESSDPYEDYGNRVLDLRDRITDLVRKVDGALPPEVAERFKEAMGTITDARGSDTMSELSAQLRQVADNRVKHSRNIMESKYEIIAEAFLLLAQLAIIAAMSFFTGGLSFGQTALAKARTRLAVLMALYRLLNQTHLMPALSEAVQEALTTFAVRLAMIALNDGKRRPDGFDARDILRSAAVGAFAGLFGSVISKYIGDVFKHQFKNFGDNKYAQFGGQAFRGAASEGPSEGLAEFIVNGLFDGKWKFDPMALAGGSASAVSEMIISSGVERFSKDLNNKFFGNHNTSGVYNPLPGAGSVLGPAGGPRGGASGAPRPTVDSSTAATATGTPTPTPTPPPRPVVPPTTVHATHTGTSTSEVPGSGTDPYPYPYLDPDTSTVHTTGTGTAPVAGPDAYPGTTGADPYTGAGRPVPDHPFGTTPLTTPEAGAIDPTPTPTPMPMPTASSLGGVDTTPAGGRGTPSSSTSPTAASTTPVPSPRGRDTTSDIAAGHTLHETPDPVRSPAASPLPDPDGLTAPNVPGTTPSATPDTTTGRAPAATGQGGTPASDHDPAARNRHLAGAGADTARTDTAGDPAPAGDARTTAPPSADGTAPAPAPHPAHTEPARPEQWRSRQASVPPAVVQVDLPTAADDAPSDTPGEVREDRAAGRTTVQRVPTDDGRWVRVLTLELPVTPGPGFSADARQDFQERMRALLDTGINNGPYLPGSGDQLHVDVRLVDHSPGAGAVELSVTDTPAVSDPLHIRLLADDPALAPAERDRRRTANDMAALRQILRHAGIRPGPEDGSGPVLPPDTLQAVEDLTGADMSTAPITTVTSSPGSPTSPAARPSVVSAGPEATPAPRTDAEATSGAPEPLLSDGPEPATTPPVRRPATASDSAPAQTTDAADAADAAGISGSRGVPEPASARALVERLLSASSAGERGVVLGGLSSVELEGLAADPVVVDALRGGLSAGEFAEVAAHLMVRVPVGVERPVSARGVVRALVARV
ncbi:WXG100-like domain-containing protein, partial [Streptomyces capillispiralis]